MTSLNTKAVKVELLRGLQAKRYSLKDICKDNYWVFKSGENEYKVTNCRTDNIEIMDSRSLHEWETTNNGTHQVIVYIL